MQQNIDLLSNKKKKQKFQSLLDPNQKVDKKSGSFGGSYNEPSVPITPNAISRSAHKQSKIDKNFGMAQAMLQQQMIEASGC